MNTVMDKSLNYLKLVSASYAGGDLAKRIVLLLLCEIVLY